MKPQLPRTNANPLIDAAVKALGLRSDAGLARYIGTSPANLSKVRHGKLPVGATLLCLLSEAMDVPVRELRKMMGSVAQ